VVPVILGLYSEMSFQIIDKGVENIAVYGCGKERERKVVRGISEIKT